MKLFELFATLGLDTTQFDAKLNQAIGVSGGLREALEQLQKESQRTGQEGGKAASFFKSQWADVKDSLRSVFTFSAGQLVAQGVSAGVNAFRQFASESIELASDLNEVQNVIDVTFGQDAKKIESWSKRAKSSIGMSELSAKQFVGTMGAMLKSSGLTGDAVSDLSIQIVEMAGDMASFYNLDHETAFQKIRSGISGETEPLKQLGINMSVANLEAFRLQQGIKTAYDKMSQSEQVELRIKYLAQATADAAGDFERTANSYANARKTFEANMDTLKSNVGAIVLPVAETGINIVNSWFDNALSVADKIKEIKEAYNLEDLQASFDALTVESLISELDALENKAQRTEEDQRKRISILRGLSEIDPDLSSIINLETGEIEGGTKALRENTKEWEANRRARAARATLDELQEEKDAANDALSQAEKDFATAESRQRAAEQSIVQLVKEYAKKTGWMYDVPSDGMQFWDFLDEAYKIASWDTSKEGLAIDAARKEYEAASDAVLSYGRTIEELRGDYDLASQAHDDFAESIEDIVDGLDNEASSLDKVSLSVDEFASSFERLEDAAKKAAEYRQQIVDDTRNQVNSLLSGFQKLETVDGWWGTDSKGNAMRFDLNADMDALQSQIDFQKQYASYLEMLRAEGNLSDDLMRYFAANISEENAERMRALVESGSARQREYSELYDERNAGNDSFVDTVADMRSELDETYQQMEDDVERLWAEIGEMKSDAGLSMEELLGGAVDGLDAALPDLETRFLDLRGMIADMVDFSDIYAVPPNLSALKTLGGMSKFNAKQSVGSWTDASGGGSFMGPVNRDIGDILNSLPGHDVGLDYVPYDNYVARLHEGERVMTRLENQQFTRGDMVGRTVGGADIVQAVTVAIQDAMNGIVVAIDGQTAGRVLTEPVSRGIAEMAWAGRFSL